MRIFEHVKAAVTVLEAARYYGLKVTRNDMVCCPFHLAGYAGLWRKPDQ